jgi:hypothetical protein
MQAQFYVYDPCRPEIKLQQNCLQFIKDDT